MQDSDDSSLEKEDVASDFYSVSSFHSVESAGSSEVTDPGSVKPQDQPYSVLCPFSHPGGSACLSIGTDFSGM